MALDTYKIKSSDYEGKDIAALPIRPTISATELQAAFDRLVKEVVVPRFNALIEELAGNFGADAIGKTIAGMNGQNAGALLEELAEKKAPLESPGFTGTPTAPTPDAAANTAQIATTAFVQEVARQLVLNSGAADMVRATYDPQNKAADIFAFAEEAARHSVLAVSLFANDWIEQGNGYRQTVSADKVEVNGYSYIVAPAAACFADYGQNGIYMGDVDTEGELTFYATTKPATTIDVNLMKIHTNNEEE